MYALWSAISSASRSRFCPVPSGRLRQIRLRPLNQCTNFFRSASIVAQTDPMPLPSAAQLPSASSLRPLQRVISAGGGAEKSRMSSAQCVYAPAVAMRVGSPSGTTPRSFTGKSFTASSNFACACRRPAARQLHAQLRLSLAAFSSTLPRHSLLLLPFLGCAPSAKGRGAATRCHRPRPAPARRPRAASSGSRV